MTGLDVSLRSPCAEALLEPVPGDTRCDLDNNVYVLRHPRLRSGWIGEPKRDGGAADEGDFVEERPQLPSSPLEHRDAHNLIPSFKSFAAS
jgi:hypothetical protein